eukprot:TRINITY_DN4434_c0_g1_i3.p1 TRINITY_DN4434_c0_g1~~TRINITY_DN4434_c0_g1_i3.p1  ORF type:complete len:632 (+),score=109.75 TRINITY_DN4434_c0_g1_i3:507-2402(+)
MTAALHLILASCSLSVDYCFQLQSPCYWCTDDNSTVCVVGDPEVPPARVCDAGWVGWADKYNLCPPVECVTKPGAWGTCSAECGGGVVTRERIVVVPSSGNETATWMPPCDLKDSRRCNTRPCGPAGRDLLVNTIRVDGVTKRPSKSYYRGWTLPSEDTSNEPLPMYTVPTDSSGLKIGWSYKDNAYFLTTDASNKQTGQTVKVGAKEVRGLSAAAFSVLASNNSLWVYESALPVMVWGEIDKFVGDSRLATGSGGAVMVYSTAYDPTNPATHGDIEREYLRGSVRDSAQWRCAPSSSHQLTFSTYLNMYISACIGGGLPGVPKRLSVFPSGDPTTGLGKYQSGVRVVDLPSDTSGRVGGELGPLVPVPNGVVACFTASDSVKGNEQASPFVGTHSQGQPFVFAIATLSYANATGVWSRQPITYPPVPPSPSMKSPQIALYGTSFTEGYLIGWQAAGKYYIMRLDANFQNTTAAEEVTSWAVWGDRNNWVTTTTGEVAWGYAWDMNIGTTDFQDGEPHLKIVRYKEGYASVIDADPVLACQGQGSDPTNPNTICVEKFREKRAQSNDSGLPTPVYVVMAMLAVAGLAGSYYLYSRSRAYVGNRRRPNKLYPWDQENAKNVEFLELHDGKAA